MHKIKVSVIMGVYNCKSYNMLEKSVKSIINQTYQDWEFIICDDGSTNQTIEYLNKIAALDKRIKIVSNKVNSGLAAALNTCIKNATGEYIARQDDDDISYPTRFEKQVAFLDNHPEYTIVGSIADVYDDNGIWGVYNLEEMPTAKSFLWNSPFAHPTVMIRKKELEKSGNYRVSKETKRSQDYDLFMRMYAKGYLGYNMQERLYKYRIENGKTKYRPMHFRIDEAKIRFRGFKNLHMLPMAFPYVIKPIVIGLIPQKIFKIIRKNQY